MTAARLVTIPFSHYCEKARWALDRAAIAYREEPHLPMFAWAPALRAGGRRTVPVLVADGEVHADSHAILRYAHQRSPGAGLYPDDVASEVEALEARFDRKLGPAARRIAYYHALPHRDALETFFLREAPAWERGMAKIALPLMIRMMRRGLRIDESGVARSEAALAEVIGEIEQRLADGRQWLFGDRFTAADLTLAALSTPLLAPPPMERWLGPYDRLPAPMRERIERHRATAAGRLALRAYDEQR